MQGTDLATPFAPGPSLPSRRSNAFLRLAFPLIIFASSAMLFAAPSRAQDNSQTNDQDVAAAAGRAALEGATPLAENAFKAPMFEALVKRAILAAAS